MNPDQFEPIRIDQLTPWSEAALPPDSFTPAWRQENETKITKPTDNNYSTPNNNNNNNNNSHNNPRGIKDFSNHPLAPPPDAIPVRKDPVFPINHSINKKVTLVRNFAAWRIQADILVVPHYSPSSLFQPHLNYTIQPRFQQHPVFHSQRLQQIRSFLLQNNDPLSNSQVVLKTSTLMSTPSFGLSASILFHILTPGYHVRYMHAAECALWSAYRAALIGSIETKKRTIVFDGALHSAGRGYPVGLGAHIALRTIRRWLERKFDDVDSIIICLPDEGEFLVYESLMSQYFPRTEKEEEEAKSLLPSDLGNEWGEPTDEQRKIRIEAFPSQTSPSKHMPSTGRFATKTENNDFQSSEEDDDEDDDRDFGKKSMATGLAEMAIPTDPDVSALNNSEQERLYFQYLVTAQNTNLNDIQQLKIIYYGGSSPKNEQVVVVIGKRLPEDIDYDRVFLYFIKFMDNIASAPYHMIYVHSGMKDKKNPDWSFMQKLYNLMQERYAKNLLALHILHPSFLLKTTLSFLGPLPNPFSFLFSAPAQPDLSTKILYYPELRQLLLKFDQKTLKLEEDVYRCDEFENGVTWSFGKKTTQNYDEL